MWSSVWCNHKLFSSFCTVFFLYCFLFHCFRRISSHTKIITCLWCDLNPKAQFMSLFEAFIFSCCICHFQNNPWFEWLVINWCILAPSFSLFWHHRFRVYCCCFFFAWWIYVGNIQEENRSSRLCSIVCDERERIQNRT